MNTQLRYETPAGFDISHAAREMVDLANEHKSEVVSDFNGLAIKALPGNDPEAVAAAYLAESKRRHDAYLASPQYAQRQLALQQAEAIKRAALAGALLASPSEPSWSDPKTWAEFVAINTDPYGKGCVDYASKWARLMEGKIAAGSKLEDCAEECSYVAADDGITGFMYGCAVSMLAQCWIFGEQLRRWHNLKTQIGHEGEAANEEGGVLNPALLSVSSC